MFQGGIFLKDVIDFVINIFAFFAMGSIQSLKVLMTFSFC